MISPNAIDCRAPPAGERNLVRRIVIERTVWLLLCSVTLSACGAAEEAASSQGATNPRVARVEERLRSVAGFREPSEVRSVVGELRTAAANGDRRMLAALVHYPFTTYDRGTPVRHYMTPDAVLAAYDTLFSERVLVALRAARYDELFVRDQGAMIGDGEVWLGQFEEGVRVKAINSGR